jgi:hypothetical protein
MGHAPEYTVRFDEGLGVWGVLEPSGHQISFYGPELDGDLAPTLAEAEAAEKTFELRFMADFLGVTREQFVAAISACRVEVDAMVARGAL